MQDVVDIVVLVTAFSFVSIYIASLEEGPKSLHGRTLRGAKSINANESTTEPHCGGVQSVK